MEEEFDRIQIEEFLEDLSLFYVKIKSFSNQLDENLFLTVSLQHSFCLEVYDQFTNRSVNMVCAFDSQNIENIEKLITVLIKQLESSSHTKENKIRTH